MDFEKSPLFKPLDNNDIQCLCCQHQCVIQPGKLGRCRVRANVNGKPYSPTWGQYTVAIDPVEKKPLYHFLPGSKVYSYGTVGCNFSCQFCQNSSLSMWKLDIEDVATLECTEGRILHRYTPEEMVLMARKNGCEAIASTYNEPTVSTEFSHKVFTLAKKRGLLTIYVTNGFESVETLNYLAPVLDAVNIDLKSFREKFYSQVCGAHLNGVCKTIQRCVAMGIHTEVTTLVIPGENDSDDELRDIAEFLASVDKEIVWHVSAYHDDYKFQGRGRTPLQTLERAARIGRAAGLVYIYLGNVHSADGRITKCPSCGEMLVERDWGNARVKLSHGKCKCGRVIPGVFPGAWNVREKINEVPADLLDKPVASEQANARNVVFFATQGHTSEAFARSIAEQLGFEVDDIKNLSVSRLAGLERVVFAVSTYGRGQPPASGAEFWAALKDLENLPTDNKPQFAVLGCGSSSFSATFVGFAKALEQKMLALGCREVIEMCVRDEMEDEDEKVDEWARQIQFK